MPLTLPTSPAQRIAGGLFIVTLLLVVWGSLVRVPPGYGSHDKIQHFAAYGALTALAFAARGRRSWLALTGVAALGGGVEILQAVLPTGRLGSFWDLLANVTGALTVWLIWTVVARFRR